jgi:hypothetical protein
MSDAKRRVEEVIDAAERAAAEIRAEAEAEASRLIEARRAEAAEIRSAAERHLTERRQEAAEIRAKAETDAGQLLEKQRAEVARAQAEAEAEAARYLAGRRAEADRLVKARQRAVSEFSQSLLGHAQGLRERAETMAGELEQTVAQIREVPDRSDVGEIENATTPDAAPTQPTNPVAESAPTRTKPPAGSSRAVGDGNPGTPRTGGRSPGTVSSGRRGGDEVPEEAVLRATQMAVEGNPREEIDRALRRKFGLTDTAPILDEILGRED